MDIKTISKTRFVLETTPGVNAASLVYQDNDFRSAEIITSGTYPMSRSGTGLWLTLSGSKIISRIKVEPAARISIRIVCRKKKYIFKKSANWKLRFSLLNKEEEELLTLLPAVNWAKESHDYILQLNEEFEADCDSFLILQALHCANLSMSMMTGGKVPALISI